MEILNNILEKYVAKVNDFESTRNALNGKINRLEFSKTLHDDFFNEIDKVCINLEKTGIPKEELKAKAKEITASFLRQVTL